ncbi:amino acid-binding protein [Arthrobacter deserti]|uniref:Amino acid-binding protein n=1 Tax=Arthrobacter deserti TaxID=1742687 RepID=A0ABX1JUD2_9MICC|nr:amino acid-binding protein [Arthrobacter deserti]
MLPLELAVHAAVVQAHLPYMLKVAILTVTATVLAIWVAEPSASRLLRRWLHAPLLHRRRRIEQAPALWRVRTVVQDQPGALERVTHALSCLDANILSINVHPVDGGVLDEFVLSAPAHLAERDLLEALEAGSGRSPRVWRTTPMALADGQTRALGLAAKVAASPADLPHAVAALLSATHLEDPAAAGRDLPADGTVLKIPSAVQGVLLFSRPGEPFTPAESARAHRLAELAETLQLQRPPGPAAG